MVDDIRIAALSAKMGVLSISDDLQIALSKRTLGGQRTAEAKVRYAAGYCPMLVYDFKPPTAWALQYATCGHS
jgi:hypothetical protein